MSTTAESPRQGLLATLTENRLLALLSDSDVPLSRSEIARLSGISKPAISDAARRLEESGVIVATGTREGKRGGVATLYEINADRGHSIALALNSAFVSVRSIRLDGTVSSENTKQLPRDASSEFVIATAKGMLESVERAAASPLLAAAISVADPVDPLTGETITMADSVFPGGHFTPVRDLNIHAMKTVVDNDVNWATLAEYHGGAMKQVDDFLYVYLGAGLGAGLFLGGILQRGTRGLAGEIGHLCLPGGEDLTRTLARLGLGDAAAGYGLDVETASKLLTQPALPASAREAVETLAIAIANMVTLLNSSAVVLGGPLAETPSLVDALATAIPNLSLDHVDVVVGTRTPLDGASHEAHRMARASLGF